MNEITIILEDKEHIGLLKSLGFKVIMQEVVLVLDLTNYSMPEVKNIDGLEIYSLYDALKLHLTVLDEIEDLRISTLREKYSCIPLWFNILSTSFNPFSFFVAIYDNELAGFSNVIESDKTSCYIEYTCVKSALRRKGIGYALKIADIKYALDNQYKEIWTINDIKNKEILSLNYKLGFKERYERIWMTKK